ncbi:putative sterol glucosyltransferase protein [Botrytis fragariae]|uniref:Putative sterol glucosyltransferase protein n=1 Tax=Botrytis fragariae TaxID=1964551 RepID=A0A8H6AQP1_9HELO|nr:putative sterol glucosyltransferase protein [Botrytis fragariae]KAF5871600.1 putative sterol glucosyltransferase protein [Botrytis fragariae]
MADSKHHEQEHNQADSPPSYGEATLSDSSLFFQKAKARDDGRIDLDLTSNVARRLSKYLDIPSYSEFDTKLPETKENRPWAVKLNIVIQVVGSRGDVQPFIALGNELQKHGHRVRIATHDQFEDFVRQANLEFYPIGGNPAELMAFMVKNPGLIPSMETLKGGEIQRKRAIISEMLGGCWRSCLKPDMISAEPFVADAIIANPPSFAHIHCAQALGIPLHLCFTMPWSPTAAFPHPLANIKTSSVDVGTGNYLSYLLVEWMTWQGLGDLINSFRESIDLEPIPYSEGPTLASSLKIPFTYCWSPALVPRPIDWPPQIDVCGFFFRDKPIYTPPPELDAFLRMRGPPLVYIGFGSIVIDNPEALTRTLLDAVHALGVRAIISKGWSNLGGADFEDIFYLDDCPHEWLFQHVSAVVHHGGAGTTACGLSNGRPTMVVPFFGDQPFWGEMINAAGAGPAPVPFKSLDTKNLVEGLRFCLTKEAAIAAGKIASKMETEDGVKTAVRSFHANLPLEDLRCDLLPDKPAAWQYKHKDQNIKLSKFAVQILLKNKRLDQEKIKLLETKHIEILNRRWDPVTAMASAYLGMATDIVQAQVGVFTKPYEEYKKAQAQNKSHRIENDSRNKQSSEISDSQSLAGGNGATSCSSSIHSTNTYNKKSDTAGLMARASGKSAGKMLVATGKGTFVDVPLAMADGIRAMPGLYGGKVKDYGKVTGWKSGMAVGGKAFGLGIVDGLADLVVQPYKGGKKEGALGVAKGIGKGTVSMISKISGGAVGVWAYPAQGIAKSISHAVHTTSKKEIQVAKREEGAWLIQEGRLISEDVKAIIDAFDLMKR